MSVHNEAKEPATQMFLISPISTVSPQMPSDG
jgi:hypothetical protein